MQVNTHVSAMGASGVLVEVAGTDQALALAAWWRETGAGVGLHAVDVVPGETSVLLDGLPAGRGIDAVRAHLARWPAEVAPTPAGEVELPTTYDGPDLADVAAAWGTDVDGVVAQHTGLTFTVAFCGFAPGFAYLSGLPPGLQVPRLDAPRTRVPAGAVALAGPWCGVYPTASPGGWRVIGRTAAALWDADRDEPALLAPGIRVRFAAT